MKKKIGIIILIAVVFSFTGVTVVANTNPNLESDFFEFLRIHKSIADDEKIAATVDGEPIYQFAIEFQQKTEELSKKNAIAYLEQSSDISEEFRQTELQKHQSPPKTDKEILKELIRSKAIFLQAKKEGLLVGEKDAYQKAKENFQLFKQSSTQKDDKFGSNAKNNQFISDYMKALDMTEDEYLKNSGEGFQYLMTKGKLLDKFKDNFFSVNNKQAQEVDTEAYIDELVKKSKIDIK